MRRTEVIIVGAGQAGLAMGRCLSELGIDHVLLERGRVAERWRSARWDSLRLLTPNWMTRLPGHRYAGADPDGYMGARQVADMLQGYADAGAAPVYEGTTVRSVRQQAGGYLVHTDRGDFFGDACVLATGACDRPAIPDFAGALPAAVAQVTPDHYRGPDGLPPGGVLVVGAAATGIQLADELRRAGREVTLSVGQHTRMPRRYRGRDIMWWLDRTGALDRAPGGASHEPSLQLVGSDDGRDIGLQTLRERGVRLVGRTAGAQGDAIHLRGDLPWHAAVADSRMQRLLDRIDAHAARMPQERPRAERPAPFTPAAGPTRLRFGAEGIASVVWATGYRRSYPWLHVPGAVRADGELRQHGGRCVVPGLYALGLPGMRSRRSTYIDGVGADARALSESIYRDVRGRKLDAA